MDQMMKGYHEPKITIHPIPKRLQHHPLKKKEKRQGFFLKQMNYKSKTASRTYLIIVMDDW